MVMPLYPCLPRRCVLFCANRYRAETRDATTSWRASTRATGGGTLSGCGLRSHPPCTHTHTPFPQGTLRDWDVEVSGAAAVGAANGKIFAAVPTISIEVLAIHVCVPTRTAVCEILVHLNDAAKTSLKVADVITFDAALKIVALRAYKG
jgi:hypothetical protein